MVLFVIVSVVYACFAGLIVALSSIRTCSIQPDIAASCDAIPVVIVTGVLAVLYLILSVWFFRAKVNGVD